MKGYDPLLAFGNLLRKRKRHRCAFAIGGLKKRTCPVSRPDFNYLVQILNLGVAAQAAFPCFDDAVDARWLPQFDLYGNERGYKTVLIVHGQMQEI